MGARLLGVRPARTADVRRVAASLIALVLQPIFFYWHVLINPSRHIPFDIEGYYFPVISYLARSVREGRAPFWDPYTYAGMPLYGDLQVQLFYPGTWLAIFAGNLNGGRNIYYWVEWLIPLHMMLAGLFALLLARRLGLSHPAALLAATVYQLGGYFASQATHLGAICDGAWLPLAILAIFEMRRGFRPRWFALLALAACLSILAGFSATTVVIAGSTIVFALALLAAREASWRVLPVLAGGWLLGAVAASIQLIPLWQLTRLSIASERAAWITAWGAPLQSLVSLMRPDYYHIFEGLTPQYKLPYNFTFLYVYCGIAPLLLILATPLVRKAGRALMFLALTIVSALWMLGEHTPIYQFVFQHLPEMVRGALYAWYAMMAFCLFVGLTAATVLDRLGSRVPEAALWILALVTGWDLIQTGRDRPMNTAPGSYQLATSDHEYMNDPAALPKLRALVDTSVPPLRIDYADIWVPGILGASMLELPTPAGNTPFMLRRVHELRQLYCGSKPSDPMPLPTRDLAVTRFDSPLLRMLNTGVLGSLSEIKDANLQPAGQAANLHLYRIPDPLPRFFLVPAVRRSSSENETFGLLAQPSFNPAEEAIVEGISSDRTGLAEGKVQVRKYEPERIEMTVEIAGPAFLATSEPTYPGWEARVNGQSQPMLMTNGAFRGLELPRGKSEIVMTYHPANLKLSLGLTILALTTAFLIFRTERSISPQAPAGSGQ